MIGCHFYDAVSVFLVVFYSVFMLSVFVFVYVIQSHLISALLCHSNKINSLWWVNSRIIIIISTLGMKTTKQTNKLLIRKEISNKFRNDFKINHRRILLRSLWCRWLCADYLEKYDFSHTFLQTHVVEMVMPRYV